MVKTILIAIISILLVGTIIVQPDTAFQASLQGLTVWWNIVFPGILPFLVLFELMTAFGLAHAASTLLGPVMHRLFKLPGEAAHAIALGWMGGYPAGAEATASLRKQNKVDQSQGQRLLAIAHMPNPLFMLVVIGAGFLHKPIVGIMIAAAVWLSALFLLLLLSIANIGSRNNVIEPSLDAAASKPQDGFVKQLTGAMQLGREQDGRSFGKVLGDAVSSSVQKLLMIGGFMIFASVLAKLAQPLFAPLLTKLNASFIGPALFESHIGAYAAAIWETPVGGSLMNAAAIAGVLAWSGLGGILQTGYTIAGTDLKLLPFAAFRMMHAVGAFLLTLLLWNPMSALLRYVTPPGTFPVFSPDQPQAAWGGPTAITASDMPMLWSYSITASLLLLTAFALLHFVSPLWRTRRIGR
ncbi:nucleoside recognition domain-containing protein [Paenibacillus harenae]|uniref:Sporulation integral membrane protein YlbJ n=1 Tax=Paenibacillus harenae TaxID=306543 RepID=A0ABT9U073_PAEHA|nr:nucleoside recognition domain-containing protein [Paenibacillus harenae]MDQ0113031.1 sporulation integral membrane protein YlbJ [Paenibacillus harenae]